MKVEKLIEEVSVFFSGKKKEQAKKSRQLEKIIDQLKSNRDKLKKQHKAAASKKKKKEIIKEYKAVVMLLTRAIKRYKKIK